MKIAVTGANGFIGAALTHELCEKGYGIMCEGLLDQKSGLLIVTATLKFLL